MLLDECLVYDELVSFLNVGLVYIKKPNVWFGVYLMIIYVIKNNVFILFTFFIINFYLFKNFV